MPCWSGLLEDGTDVVVFFCSKLTGVLVDNHQIGTSFLSIEGPIVKFVTRFWGSSEVSHLTHGDFISRVEGFVIEVVILVIGSNGALGSVLLECKDDPLKALS